MQPIPAVYFKKEQGADYQARLQLEFTHKIDLRLKAVLFELADWMRRVLNKDLIITCLIRSVDENKAVNGKHWSAHLFARAWDMRTAHLSQAEIDKVQEHLMAVWGKEFLFVLYHDSGSGNHIHGNITLKYAKSILT